MFHFCSLEYPPELLNEHNNYPFCPSHKTITEDMLSDFQREQAKKLNIQVGRTEKLIADLTDKDGYILHFR